MKAEYSGDLSGLTFSSEPPPALPGMRRSVFLRLLLIGGCVWIALALALRAVWLWLDGRQALLAAFALLALIGGGGFWLGVRWGRCHAEVRFVDARSYEDERVAFWKSQATLYQRKAAVRKAQLDQALEEHWPVVVGFEGRES